MKPLNSLALNSTQSEGKRGRVREESGGRRRSWRGEVGIEKVAWKMKAGTWPEKGRGRMDIQREDREEVLSKREKGRVKHGWPCVIDSRIVAQESPSKPCGCQQVY